MFLKKDQRLNWIELDNWEGIWSKTQMVHEGIWSNEKLNHRNNWTIERELVETFPSHGTFITFVNKLLFLSFCPYILLDFKILFVSLVIFIKWVAFKILFCEKGELWAKALVGTPFGNNMKTHWELGKCQWKHVGNMIGTQEFEISISPLSKGKKMNILLTSNMLSHLIGYMHILFVNMVATIFFWLI